MRSLKTTGIILKRMDLGEADRLLTIFTYDQGKVRALNKGARKPLSKLAGHLEPFSLTECQFQEGRSFYTITAAEIRQSFDPIRSELGKTSLAYYLLDMVDALTADAEPQPMVFELLEETLAHLAEAGDQDPLLVLAFTFKLLVLLGYRPELTRCVHCHIPLVAENNTFSARIGGILGAECRREDETAIPISVNTIKVLRVMADRSVIVATKLGLDDQIQKELKLIIERYLQFQTGRDLRSADFVRQAAL